MKVIRMKKSDVSQQAELTRKLRKASDAYYEGRAIMEDMEFDKLLEKLTVLERENGFAYDMSPNIRVGAAVLPEKVKVEHEYPALSLDKIKYLESGKLVTFLGERDGVLSLKMDGLTVVATYENGALVRAATRGDGRIGQDVTHNARFFEGLPVRIPYKKKLIVRGEAVMPFEEFERINEKIRERNEQMLLGTDDPDDVSEDLLEPYSNARGLASATVQMLDSTKSRRRRIEFYAFKVVFPMPVSGKKSNDLMLLFQWLEKQGFNTVRRWPVTPENVIGTALDIGRNVVETLPYPTDGLVLTFRDRAYAESMGQTGRVDRGSIAFKWSEELEETNVRDIIWSVGKEGEITPVAEFDHPVYMGLGSTVRRASLANPSVAENTPVFGGDCTAVCGIGSHVHVGLANAIIPKIFFTTEGRLEIPETCPVCGEPVEIVTKKRKGMPDVKRVFCVNPECGAKHIGRLVTFASKDGLNIEGLSEKKIQDLMDLGLVRHPADFYTLHDKNLTSLMETDKWGEKSVQNLLDAIERSRETDLTHFLYTIPAGLLGHDLSRILDRVFKSSIKEFLAWIETPERYDLSSVEGIGPVKLGNLMEWRNELMADEDRYGRFHELVNELTFRVPETAAPDEEEGKESVKGLTFVITGKVYDYKNRKEFEESVIRRGGRVAGSVSKNTNFLITNEASNSTKSRKAAELGIKTMTEAEFIERFGR